MSWPVRDHHGQGGAAVAREGGASTRKPCVKGHEGIGVVPERLEGSGRCSVDVGLHPRAVDQLRSPTPETRPHVAGGGKRSETRVELTANVTGCRYSCRSRAPWTEAPSHAAPDCAERYVRLPPSLSTRLGRRLGVLAATVKSGSPRSKLQALQLRLSLA